MPVAMCVYLVCWELSGHHAVCTAWFCHLTWSLELPGVVARECLHDTTLSRDLMLCLVSKQRLVADGCQCKYEAGAFQVIWALLCTKNKPRMKKRLQSCSTWLCCCSKHFHILRKPPHLLSLAIVFFTSLRPAWILSALDIQVSFASSPTSVFKVLTLNDPVVTTRTTGEGEQKPGLKSCSVDSALAVPKAEDTNSMTNTDALSHLSLLLAVAATSLWLQPRWLTSLGVVNVFVIVVFNDT